MFEIEEERRVRREREGERAREMLERFEQRRQATAGCSFRREPSEGRGEAPARPHRVKRSRSGKGQGRIRNFCLGRQMLHVVKDKKVFFLQRSKLRNRECRKRNIKRYVDE